MVRVFEKRVRENCYREEIERVTDWRKGIAVARSYSSSSYYLIDKDFNTLYHIACLYLKEIGGQIEGGQIERVFGGYYIVRDVHASVCRTFPGQDRDTEYDYYTYVEAVLDENGTALSKEEEKKYLDKNPIKHTMEYGEGIVECESSFYRLDTYQYLFSIPKTLKPMGFYKDGRFRVGVVSDYRDFYVLVKEKKIITVYDAQQFDFIKKLFDIYCEKDLRIEDAKKEETYRSSLKRPEGCVKVKEIEPEIIVVIDNYLSEISSTYEIYFWNFFELDENYGIYRRTYQTETHYYFVEGEWRMIDGSVAQKIGKKILEQEKNRPNFIGNITRIVTGIVLDGEIYSIFKFMCRPYGYITKDGKFDYDFDVNNIQW